jgi:cyanophycinase
VLTALLHGNSTHGPILLVGGAEERSARGLILQTFLTLCQKRNPVILLIDAASRRPGRMNREYERAFLDLGASRVLSPRLLRVEDANREDFVSAVLEADAVYFAGGDQSRLTRALQGSRGLALLRARHVAGDLVVGGTSAGASALSETMIAGGRSGLWPRKGMVDLDRGLGIASGIVVDQHFRQRARQGRLIEAALRLSRQRMDAIGVDERTALTLRGDGTVEVTGDGAAVYISTPENGHQAWCQAQVGDIIRIPALTVSIIPHGTHIAAGELSSSEERSNA